MELRSPGYASTTDRFALRGGVFGSVYAHAAAAVPGVGTYSANGCLSSPAQAKKLQASYASGTDRFALRGGVFGSVYAHAAADVPGAGTYMQDKAPQHAASMRSGLLEGPPEDTLAGRGSDVQHFSWRQASTRLPQPRGTSLMLVMDALREASRSAQAAADSAVAETAVASACLECALQAPCPLSLEASKAEAAKRISRRFETSQLAQEDGHRDPSQTNEALPSALVSARLEHERAAAMLRAAEETLRGAKAAVNIRGLAAYQQSMDDFLDGPVWPQGA